MQLISLTLISLWLHHVLALDNGMALTPPMGWLSWERFRCNMDCENFPDTCISEKLYMQMADRLVHEGWLEVGYDHVNIDDCWSARERDHETNEIYPNPKLFPSGMKNLSDYMHARGLKLGLYADIGTKTCAGYPGTMGYEELDAKTFASWGIDMIKVDGCNADKAQLLEHYPRFGRALNATGRKILYSCEWPLYVKELPPTVNYTYLGEISNMWRNYNDIDDTFEDVIAIINWWGDHQDFLIPAAGPGRWNDPDMLIGGDFALSYEQSKLQFGMWAILAAPLFMSNDLRDIDPRIKGVLQNKYVIDINQDPLGKQGRRIKGGDMQLWVRPLIDHELAIAIINFRVAGGPSGYTFSISELEVEYPAKMYAVWDIYNENPQPKFYRFDDQITDRVNPNGIVMLKAIPYVPRGNVMVEEKMKIDVLEQMVGF